MSYNQRSYLFADYDLTGTLRNIREGIKAKVDAIPKDQFLNSPIDDLVEYLIDQSEVEPLVLHEDRMEMLEPKECKVDVSHDRSRYFSMRDGPCLIDGTRITIEIPFSGDKVLWQQQPSTHQMGGGPIFNVQPGKLVKVYELPHDADAGRLKGNLDRELADLKKYLGWQERDIEQHNKVLKGLVVQAIEGRREKLGKQGGIADIFGIPLKSREGATHFNPIKVKKKIARTLPPPPREGYKPEPGITDGDYTNALNIIRHTGMSFERTPKTFLVHDEEELRDIVLSNLNTHFEGEAKGEAFNKNGKTDIHISSDGRSAFIGECKIWRGAKGLNEAVDQLLEYLTWRDCKTALIIFNKENKDFSGILNQIQPLMEAHHAFVRFGGQLDENEWHFVMQAKDDESRQVQVRVMIFNLYTSK